MTHDHPPYMPVDPPQSSDHGGVGADQVDVEPSRTDRIWSWIGAMSLAAFAVMAAAIYLDPSGGSSDATSTSVATAEQTADDAVAHPGESVDGPSDGVLGPDGTQPPDGMGPPGGSGPRGGGPPPPGTAPSGEPQN